MIIREKRLRILFNRSGEVRQRFFQAPGLTVTVPSAAKRVDIAVFLHNGGSVFYRPVVKTEFAVGIAPADMDLLMFSIHLLQFVIPLDRRGKITGMFIEIAE